MVDVRCTLLLRAAVRGALRCAGDVEATPWVCPLAWRRAIWGYYDVAYNGAVGASVRYGRST
jgi:hypothetical protein